MSQFEFVLHGVSVPVNNLAARQACDALSGDLATTRHVVQSQGLLVFYEHFFQQSKEKQLN
jgi:hypothetical protein